MAPNASTGRRAEKAENEIMEELLLLLELQHTEEMAELERQAEELERRTEELKRHCEELEQLERQTEEKQRQAAELSRVIGEEKCRLEKIKRQTEFLERLDDEFARMNAEWTFLTPEENQCRIDKLKTMVESFIHTTGDDEDGTFASMYAYLLRVERLEPARGLSLISSVKVTEDKDEPSVDDDVQCVPSGYVPLD